jgi:hypothetical protein
MKLRHSSAMNWITKTNLRHAEFISASKFRNAFWFFLAKQKEHNLQIIFTIYIINLFVTFKKNSVGKVFVQFKVTLQIQRRNNTIVFCGITPIKRWKVFF